MIMISNGASARTSGVASPTRYDSLDFARSLAILGMLGSHLVGTEGGATLLERSLTGLFAAVEPVIAALFCVVAGVSWSIQAEQGGGGVTPRFRSYFLRRALALGVFGVFFHTLFWSTEILVPFALMMALALVVLGARTRTIAIALLVVVAVTPIVSSLVAPYAATDWFENGLHAADYGVGWVTLRYLLVDGNYPLIAWMAFPLLGMLFWRTARSPGRLRGWLYGSLGAGVVAWAIAAYAAPAGGVDEIRRWIAYGWTPTSPVFVLAAGGGALVVTSALLLRWGTGALPAVAKPLVLFGRASLSQYVLHIGIACSLLRLRYPDLDWPPGTGLPVMLAYLAISIPLTVVWFRHHTQGPFEMLWARASRRPRQHAVKRGHSDSVVIVRNSSSVSLHAVRSFAPGDAVFPLQGQPVRQATRYTIQVGPNAHLDPVDERESPWRFLNHGCDPNVAIDTARRVIVARRPIAAHEEIRFDYNTTEWELAESFVCNCGAPQCVGVAMGFGHLAPARQEVLFPDAAPHIRVLYARQLRAVERVPTGSALGVIGHGA
jgi:uncharacterized membrane protein YeiB